MALATVYLALLANGEAESAAAVPYALDLAARSGARLLASLAVPPLAVPALAYSGYAVATQMLMVVERENLARKQDAEAKALLIAAEAEKLGVSAGVEVVSAPGEPLAPRLLRLARVSDLCIVNAPPPADPAQHDLVIDLLFGAGIPFLVVPAAWRGGASIGKVHIAWDGGRAAARAVHDALPLLQRAGTVEIVCVQGEKESGQESAADLEAHLARVCSSVTTTTLPCDEGGVAAALRQYASDQGADLMVMGAYGHSRWREFVLGGATRDMLSQIAVPTLMSH